MRILAGDLKYKKVSYIKDKNLRPTRSIVRKSFFDTIQGNVFGCVFLDLFAGVGSMGFEAASRGAKEIIFVDKAYRSIEVINKNISEFNLGCKFTPMRMNAYDFIDSPSMRLVDVAYIDAPYSFDVNSFLKEFFGKINKNAIVCVEHLKGKDIDNVFLEFKKVKSKSFGKNSLDYFEV
jgi:16S rRNA (guanine966-N2)-methyltransferase